MEISDAATPSLPPELWHLILSPDLLSRPEAVGVPLVCRSWFWPGQALLWHDMVVELGSWRNDLAHDAVLDQPRFRDNLMKGITIELNNTAEFPWKMERQQSALRELQVLLELLPPMKNIALMVDGKSTGVIWEMLDALLAAPCSAGLHFLRLATSSTAATGSILGPACLHKLETSPTLRALELQVDTLHPIMNNFRAATTLPLTTLSLVNGSLNLATATLSLLRICQHSLRRCRLNGAVRWAELVLDELSRDAAGYDLRALIVAGLGGTTENDRFPSAEDVASSIAILALLPSLFGNHPRLKSLALGPLVGLDALCSREPTTTPAPHFWTTLPPTLEDLALRAYLANNPTPTLDFLRSRRCPQLRALQVAASSGRAVTRVGAQFGVTVNVSGRLTDPVWHI